MHRGGGTPERTDLLAGLRRLFAVFTLITVAGALLQMPLAEVPVWPQLTVAMGAMLGMAAWSVALWRVRLPLVVFDVAMLALLTAIAWPLGDVLWIFSVSFVGLYQRALYGSRRHAFVFTGVLFLLWETLGALPTDAEAIAPATSVALLIGLMFSAWLMQTIKGLVERQERMVARELTLASAAHDLLMCQDPGAIEHIAVRAAAGLPMAGLTVASLWRQRDGELVLLSASGEEMGLDRMPLSIMAPHVREAYEAGRPSLAVADQVRAGERELRQDAKYHTALMAPVVRGGRPWGLLTVACTETPDEGLIDVVSRFAVEVSLAVERAELLAALAEREARFASVVQNTSDVILIIDRTGVVLFANDAVHAAFGFSPEAVEGSSILEMLHPDDRAMVAGAVQGPDGPIDDVRFDCRMLTEDDQVRDVEVTSNLVAERGEPQFVVNVRDVTDRRRMEAEMAHRAFHDPVTGLANRLLFADRISHATAAAGRTKLARAVALIDLDDFKSVNDSLGHDAGDQLLVVVAERLSAAIRPNDTAARLGGDEFAVLLDGVRDASDALDIVGRVLASLEQPVTVAGREVPVRASVGVAVATEAKASDAFLRDADAAMYVAKSHGKHRIELFQPEMHATVLRRLELRAELRDALDRGEFEVHYQPIVDLGTREVISIEALLRWHHPERGAVTPDEFIPIAEQSGVILELGRWVLESACRTVADLGEDTSVGLNVNVSARQLQDRDFPEVVAGALELSGLRADRLVLEVTETAILEDPVAAGISLEAIRGLGVRVAVDDFGTGHSSLLHLQHLPIDVVKVDRIFVDAAGDGSGGARLVRAIRQLAGVLEVDVVAEGIETEDQASVLREHGYAVGQGFLYARPMPASALQQLLLQGQAPAKDLCH